MGEGGGKKGKGLGGNLGGGPLGTNLQPTFFFFLQILYRYLYVNLLFSPPTFYISPHTLKIRNIPVTTFLEITPIKIIIPVWTLSCLRSLPL